MNWFGFILAQCLNALSQASILFFIACGLTLIFGIMRIVNFAHGVVFMLGAYVGYTANVVTGSFLLSLVIAPIVVRLVGMAFEALLRTLWPTRRRRLSPAHLRARRGVERADPADLGRAALGTGIPDFLRGIVSSSTSPSTLSAVPDRAQGRRRAPSGSSSARAPGLLIRAVSQNSEMVRALVPTSTWCVPGLRLRLRARRARRRAGGALVCLLGMGTSVVIDAFVIVIIGGMGSILGSIIGSVLVAFVQVMGLLLPGISRWRSYLLMLLVLVVRPAAWERRW
jgi:branched-chain amino acid transport system permease protein